MATKKKDPKDLLDAGRPSEYKPEYCAMLIKHYAEGGTFETFAADLNKSKQTLYNWTEVYPEFMDAKKIGEGKSLKFWLNAGKMISLGQLRRIKKETPVLGTDGKPMFDKHGELITEKEYESTSAGQSTWIFIMKNVHKWRDRVALSGEDPEDAPPISFDFSGKSDEELEARLTELMLKAQKKKK